MVAFIIEPKDKYACLSRISEIIQIGSSVLVCTVTGDDETLVTFSFRSRQLIKQRIALFRLIRLGKVS